jgi:hypothetical protein
VQVGAALGDEAGEIVAVAIAEGQRMLDSELLDPLFNAITDHLEGILRQIHYVDYSAPDKAGAAGGEWCAKFLRVFTKRVQEVQQGVLVRLTCKDTAARRVLNMCSRLLDVFVRHACMVSRLSEDGKMRLASDLAQLELALAPLGCNLAECGTSYVPLFVLVLQSSLSLVCTAVHLTSGMLHRTCPMSSVQTHTRARTHTHTHGGSARLRSPSLVLF